MNDNTEEIIAVIVLFICIGFYIWGTVYTNGGLGWFN